MKYLWLLIIIVALTNGTVKEFNADSWTLRVKGLIFTPRVAEYEFYLKGEKVASVPFDAVNYIEEVKENE